MNYENKVNEVCERAMEKRNMPLYDLIMSENLQRYVRGRVDIFYGNELNNAMVPCRGFMILAKDRYDDDKHDWVAEYAIYRRAGKDSFGDDISDTSGNVFMCEAVYYLEYVGEETFENMASAISYATNLIYSMKESEE